jgi:hypothetical protein
MFIRGVAIASCLLAAATSMADPPTKSDEASDPNRAVIYVCRNSDLMDYGGIYPNLMIDGVGKHPMKNQRCLRFEVEPGTHRIEVISKMQMSLVTWPHREITVDSAANKTYYVRYHVWTTDYGYNSRTLQTAFFALPESEGEALYAKNRISEEKARKAPNGPRR